MNKDYKWVFGKATEGLAKDEYGLLEGDEILRSEIINAKLDYLIDMMGKVANLCVGLHSRKPIHYVQEFNDESQKSHEQTSREIVRAVNQYKERKKCKKIVNYLVAEGCDVEDLTETVRMAWLNGWQPLGAAFKSDEIGGRPYYAQTMVKYEEE